MPKYTAGWITVPGKGKRWRTEDGEFLMQRPAGGGLQGVLGALGSAWREADRAVGGWLPGGGTASPVTRAAQNPARTAGQFRDQVVIPALDSAMEAGVVPGTYGMYARFLTGTTKPLANVPRSIRDSELEMINGISKVQRQIAQRETASLKDLETARGLAKQIQDMQAGFTIGGPLPSADIQKQFVQLMNESQGANRRLGLGENTGLSDFNRMIEAKREYLREATTPVDPRNYTRSNYASNTFGWKPENGLDMSLGAYSMRNGVVRDRYDFEYYEPGKTSYFHNNDMTSWKGAFNLLRAGNPRGLIPVAHNLGLIRPGQGYDVRMPIR